MEDVYDGYISKHLNRKLSEPIAQRLAKTRLTPNEITWTAFGIACLSFISFLFGQNIIGGLLTQLSSIVDGVDGSLARLKGMTTKSGAFLDSILDRYADILILLGLTLWVSIHETYPGIWLAGFLAITGTICISYTRARIDSAHRHIFNRGISSLASRDIRLFVIMLGGITGQGYVCLIAIAALTHLVVFYRLFYAYKYLH
jgi:CDP-L-myo-inositol myo-inositolphosphotransferase